MSTTAFLGMNAESRTLGWAGCGASVVPDHFMSEEPEGGLANPAPINYCARRLNPLFIRIDEVHEGLDVIAMSQSGVVFAHL